MPASSGASTSGTTGSPTVENTAGSSGNGGAVSSGGSAGAREESAAGLATSGGSAGSPSQAPCPSETRALLENGECVDRFEELSVGGSPTNIAISRDGTIWFSDDGTNEIVAIDKLGHVLRRIPLPSQMARRELLAGRSDDVILWYTDTATKTLSQVTSAGPTKSFPLGQEITGITLAPNGHLFAADMVGRAIHEVDEAGTLLNSWEAYPTATITTDPEGNLWYPQAGGQVAIVRRTPTGEVTPIGVSTGVPTDLSVGSDGAIWFVDVVLHQVGRVEPTGDFRTYDLPPGSSPERIVAGWDEALWFTERVGNQIGRISVKSRVVTHYTIPTEVSGPYGITRAADGSLWFTERAKGKIGHLIPDALPRP